MIRESATSFDPTQPALIVTYGTATKRHKLLDRDLIVLGKSRTCDLPLSGPEIADIHCVIVRTADGWMIRDCGSRAGTRVNGLPVQTAPLDDGDVIQLGRFAFQAHLPAEAKAPERASGHVVRSRRRLVALALRLRHKLREERLARRRVEGQPKTGNKQAEQLRDRLRIIEQREARLEKSEKDLAKEIAALESRREAEDRHLAEAKAELERRAAAFTARHQEQAMLAADILEESRRLELRRQELNHLAAHLNRCRDRGEPMSTAPIPADDVVPQPVGLPAEIDHELQQQIRQLQQERQELLNRLDGLEAELIDRRSRSGTYRTVASKEMLQYEEELIAFRQGLEKERRELEEETQQLQTRHQEIDELARIMELEMSRERAKLAQERAELNRMREEISHEHERRKNDPVRERLAGLQRLKKG